jgi:hypothetical protein
MVVAAGPAMKLARSTTFRSEKILAEFVIGLSCGQNPTLRILQSLIDPIPGGVSGYAANALLIGRDHVESAR